MGLATATKSASPRMLALLFDDGTLAPRHLFSSHILYNFRLVPARLRSLRKKKKNFRSPIG